MISSKIHLRKKKDFDLVFKTGRASYDQIMGIKTVLNTFSVNRVGIVVSNKVSKKAVLRNQMRRRMRYIINKYSEQAILGNDFVIIMLPAALGQPFAVLEKSFYQNLKRLRMINKQINVEKSA